MLSLGTGLGAHVNAGALNKREGYEGVNIKTTANKHKSPRDALRGPWKWPSGLRAERTS